MKLLIASNNKGKIKEVSEILGDFVEIMSLKDIGIEYDVLEDKETFSDNAIKKATEIANISGIPTISDDSGILIPELNNWPGVYTKRLNKSGIGEDMSDSERNQFILEKCKNLISRTVIWQTSVAICFPKENIIKVFDGKIEGKLPNNSYGNNGFGFDSIFEIETGKTIACLTDEEKNNISPRKIALFKLKEYLNTYKSQTN